MNYEELKNLALESGFTHAAPLDTATIELKQDVRDMCAQGCQQYAKRWSCPPGCGTLDQLRGSIYCYKEGILVQTVTKLEDEFDWDGMMKAQNLHQEHFLAFLENSTPLIFLSCHSEPDAACSAKPAPTRMHPAASREKGFLRWKHVVCWYRKYVRRIT